MLEVSGQDLLREFGDVFDDEPVSLGVPGDNVVVLLLLSERSLYLQYLVSFG